MLSRINNSQQNVTPFTAKLLLNEIDKLVKVSPERLQDIQDRFEKETKNNDESYFQKSKDEHHLKFEVDDDDSNLAIVVVNEGDQGALNKETLEKLFKMNNRAVTSKLVKLYNVLQKTNEEYNMIHHLVIKQIQYDYIHSIDIQELYEIWEAIKGYLRDARRMELDKDPVLKNFEDWLA